MESLTLATPGKLPPLGSIDRTPKMDNRSSNYKFQNDRVTPSKSMILERGVMRTALEGGSPPNAFNGTLANAQSMK